MNLPLPARAFIALIMAAGAGVLATTASRGSGAHAARLAVFLVAACVSARLKVKLPGLAGSMSINLPFILVAVAELSPAEALAVGCLSNLTQCLPRTGQKFSWVQAAFNVNAMVLAVASACWIYGNSRLAARIASSSWRIMITAAGFFLINTALVAIAIALAEKRHPLHTWMRIFDLTFPYFLLSAGTAAVALMPAGVSAWQAAVAILLPMLLVFASYRRYFSPAPQFIVGVLHEPGGFDPVAGPAVEAKA